MSIDDVSILSDAYRAYRARVHRLVLQESPAVVSEDEFEAFRSGVESIWQALMTKK